MAERPQGWLNMAEFDPAPGGPFAATYNDGSGIRLFIAIDGVIVDGEDLCECAPDHSDYSLYSWLPADFRTWGMENAA